MCEHWADRFCSKRIEQRIKESQEKSEEKKMEVSRAHSHTFDRARANANLRADHSYTVLHAARSDGRRRITKSFLISQRSGPALTKVIYSAISPLYLG